MNNFLDRLAQVILWTFLTALVVGLGGAFLYAMWLSPWWMWIVAAGCFGVSWAGFRLG